MKKYVLSAAALSLAIIFLLSQRNADSRSELRFEQSSKPQSARATAFAVSRPLRELAEPVESGHRTTDLALRSLGVDSASLADRQFKQDADASLAHFGTTPMPEPLNSFGGLSDLDNANIFALLIIPPDMNGDVGPNH